MVGLNGKKEEEEEDIGWYFRKGKVWCNLESWNLWKKNNIDARDNYYLLGDRKVNWNVRNDRLFEEYD